MVTIWAGANVFFVVSSLVMSVVILICVCFLVIKFGHPDDKNEAKFPKAVVIFGLCLSFGSVLVMPYDIANSRGAGGGLRVDLLWQMIHILLALMIFFIIPYAYFFYENDMSEAEAREKRCCASQAGQAFIYTCMFAVVLILLMVILYAFVHETTIPVTAVYYSASKGAVQAWIAAQANTFDCKDIPCRGRRTTSWTVPVTFPIYLVAFIAFIGWFIFTIFVGVGMIALPLDLINEYRTRPKPLTQKERVETKQKIGAMAEEIVLHGQELKERMDSHSSATRSQKRKNKKQFKQFEIQYNIVKHEYKKFEITEKIMGDDWGTYILWGWAKLVGGILCGILSLTWIIHICVFIFPSPPVHNFLNDFFILLEGGDSGFPLFGVLAFAIWSYYLLWACVKGSFKVGLRFFCWKLYPMKLEGTLMNSFLVNTYLLLLCSVPCIQFCTQSFPVYARFTDVDMIFGTQIKYLNFFRYFWVYNVFIYVMLVLIFLTAVYLLVWPDDSAKRIQAQIEKKAGKR